MKPKSADSVTVITTCPLRFSNLAPSLARRSRFHLCWISGRLSYKKWLGIRKLEVTLQIHVLATDPRVPENQKTLAFSRLLAPCSSPFTVFHERPTMQWACKRRTFKGNRLFFCAENSRSLIKSCRYTPLWCILGVKLGAKYCREPKTLEHGYLSHLSSIYQMLPNSQT